MKYNFFLYSPGFLDFDPDKISNKLEIDQKMCSDPLNNIMKVPEIPRCGKSAILEKPRWPPKLREQFQKFPDFSASYRPIILWID